MELAVGDNMPPGGNIQAADVKDSMPCAHIHPAIDDMGSGTSDEVHAYRAL